jgi:uncharacterized lipoprotein
MNKKILALASYLAIVTLSGCALMTASQIELQYNQQAGISQLPEAKDVSVNVQVTDQRPDKSKISSKTGAFGIGGGAILPAEDVTITIRRAIEQELRARGFQIVSGTALIQIEANITQFYSEFKIGNFSSDAVADLNMSVITKSKKGDILFSRQVVAQGIDSNVHRIVPEHPRFALNRALENGMKLLFDDRAFLAALLPSPASK